MQISQALKPARVGCLAAALLLFGCAHFPKAPAAKSKNVSIPARSVVAADGSGDYKTIQAALDAIPKDNAERWVVEIRDGVYPEKVRIDANCVTLRGQSREGARIAFNQGNEAFSANRDDIGRAVININGDDCVIENLTAENTFPDIGPHAFTIYGRGTRTVIQNANCISQGADTVSLWHQGGGMYYHANCFFKGSVDFVCPRGWCYIRDSKFYENKAESATIWHDGDTDPSKKFVLRNCSFDGIKDFALGRRHHDAQFYLLDCTFSEAMKDGPIFRKTYPEQPSRDGPNQWGDRSYFYNAHRTGGDYAWHADNLQTAAGAPKPEQIDAAWTFGGAWDPESDAAPSIMAVRPTKAGVEVKFSEAVTVFGKPRLNAANGTGFDYSSGSGSETLFFGGGDSAMLLDLNGGMIVASQAGAQARAVGDGAKLQ